MPLASQNSLKDNTMTTREKTQHALSEACFFDSQRLRIARYLGDRKMQELIEASIIRKANVLLAVLTVKEA
jgi:hypothetical protein